MANEPTTEIMNELISLFMGVKPYEDSRYGRLYNSPVDGKTCFSLQYHTSWDALMPVWFKIQTIGADMGYSFKKFHEAFHAGIDHQSIVKCHKSVYQFITWYQSNK